MHIVKRIFLASLPLLSTATPVEDSAEFGIRIPLSKRGGHIGEDGHADLARLNSHIFHTTDKFVRGLVNYKVNTGLEHPSLFVDTQAHSRLVKRASVVGVVPLLPSRDMLWYGNFSIGTPPKYFTTDFDSGSSDIIVPGVTCIDDNCNGHNKFDPSLSSTSQALGGNATLRYGDGSAVQLSRYADTLSVANGVILSKNQTFGVASAYNTGFNINRFIPDGIFGLAFQRLSVTGAVPFMQQAAKQLGIPAIFSFMLSKGAEGDSELTFGNIRPSGCKGNITWFDIEEEAYWQVTVDSIGAQGVAVPVGPVKAVFDSGTTMILGDEKSVSQVYASIPGAKAIGNGQYSVPCGTIPPIDMRLGDYVVTIDPEDFNMGGIANSPDCLGGIASSPVLKFWIVGDTCLKGICAFFDYDRKRLGILDRP